VILDHCPYFCGSPTAVKNTVTNIATSYAGVIINKVTFQISADILEIIAFAYIFSAFTAHMISGCYTYTLANIFYYVHRISINALFKHFSSSPH
jgi:hypothetical protein